MSTPSPEHDHPALFDVPEATTEIPRFPVSTGPSIAERNAAFEASAAHERDYGSPHAELGGNVRVTEAVPAMRRSPNIRPLGRRRRSNAGPVRGEDALPHLDQRLAPEAVGDFRDGMRKVQQVLAALATERVAALSDNDVRSRALKQKRTDDLKS